MKSTVHTADIQNRWDTRTKPRGSLGYLERLAIQIGSVLKTTTPSFNRPHILVFAGDHGVAAEGVSAFPQAVTFQMVQNYIGGGAAINVLARQQGLGLSVVDAGVLTPSTAKPGLVEMCVARGTRNFLYDSAMTLSECEQALITGRRIVRQLIQEGSNALLLGEMGIGNTASASLMLHRVTGWPIHQCVGRGTGLDENGLARKLAILTAASNRVSRPLSPTDLVAEFGGFELAMLVGAILECANHPCLAIVDGFTVSVCALLAKQMQSHTLEHCVFSHCSAEQAHRALLDHLGVRPLLDLELRLGEGSGAALAWPLIDASARLLTEMSSFESAGVSAASV